MTASHALSQLSYSPTLYPVMGLITCSNPRAELDAKGIPYTQEEYFRRVKMGDVTTVKMFLEAGIEVDAIGKGGKTSLHHAALRANKEMVELLLQAGANPHHKDYNNSTVISWVKTWTRRATPDRAKTMQEIGKTLKKYTPK